MADIGNQLEGATEGLGRFLEALDASSMGLGSQDALKKIQARAEQKRLAQNLRFKAKIDKLEKGKEKSLLESIKNMKVFNKNMADMAKKGLGKGMSMIKGAMKAGVIGAAVLAIKAIVDGMLKVDAMMGGLVKGTGRLRAGLGNVQKAVEDTAFDMSTLGVTLTQVAAEAVNLTQQFGKMSFITGDVIKLSLQMQKAFGMAAESSGQMIESLTRINVNAREFVETLRKDAVMAGTNVSLVMRNMASISKDISIQNARSVESLKQMAIDAARAGVGVEELNKMGGAFMDPAQIGENIGKAAQLLGGNIGKLNPFKLWNLADQPQKIEDLNKEVLGALGSTVKLDREGNLVMNNGLAIRRSQLKVMTDLSGMSEEAVLRTLKMNEEYEGMEKHMKRLYPNVEEIKNQFLDMQEAALSITNKKTGERYTKQEFKRMVQQGKITKDVLKQYAARKKEAEVQDAMNQTIKEQQTILERIKNIAMGVFNNITLAMSQIFGLDKRGDDSLAGQIEGISAIIEEKLSLKTLKADIDDMGWVKALEDRLAPVGEFLGNLMVKAVDRMIAHMRKDSWLWQLFTGKTETERTQEAIATAESQMSKGRMKQARGSIKGQAMYKKMATQTRGASGYGENIDMERWALALQMSADKKEGFAGAQKIYGELGRKTAQNVSPESMDGGFGGDKPMAKGGLVTRPTRALIGEAGPELVLPLGGGARRIVPLSGTQRFQTGGDIIPLSAGMFTGITAGTGTLVGSGSEARRREVGSANIAERRRQQAPMMEYWRKEYNKRLEDMEARQKQNSKSWQDYAKKFFLKYEDEVGVALGKAFGSGPAGKEMSKALMTGMNAWSNGASAKDALSLGVRAGLTESMKEGGTMDKFFKRHDNVLMSGLQEGLMAFARTGSMKQAKRSLVAGGARAIAQKYMGDKAMGQASQYMMPTGGMPGMSAGGMPTRAEAGHIGLRALLGMPPGAAAGRVVNSPGLFMAGEGGSREVIVPTDRIRKGLPINAGVARELGSIGVPGFENGGEPSAFQQYQKRTERARKYAGGASDTDQFWTNTLVTQRKKAMEGLDYGGRTGFRFEEMGGFGGMAKAGGAGALMSFADTFAQTGDWGRSATAGVGAGAGVGIGMGLSAVGIPPPLSTMAGQFAGQLITKGLNKTFGLTGGYGKGRRRAAKSIDQHIKSGGLFDFGQPSGLGKAINLAMGGKEKTPTETNYQKLADRLNKIKGLARAGVDADTMIGLATGKITGPQAMDTYKRMNIALYGSAAGDKYMKGVATPQLAAGGIITRPTVATIGEGGPEMVIPLHEQRESNQNLIKEMKEQNKLMKLMIQTQKDTAGSEIIMDGRKVAEAVSENFYDIGSGI